jgi:hypothetical protein
MWDSNPRSLNRELILHQFPALKSKLLIQDFNILNIVSLKEYDHCWSLNDYIRTKSVLAPTTIFPSSSLKHGFDLILTFFKLIANKVFIETPQS